MLTLRELALVSGVAPRLIWAIEAGRATPDADDVRRICVALSVSPLDVADFRRAIDVQATAS
ncbi:MAG: helix-turn-helix domain-containing protein [Chloroflexota bacterium]|nr:helix-turn-helix domain-containing protein [Chloroflexota bacterium]